MKNNAGNDASNVVAKTIIGVAIVIFIVPLIFLGPLGFLFVV